MDTMNEYTANDPIKHFAAIKGEPTQFTFDKNSRDDYRSVITDFFRANGVQLRIVGTESGPVITKYIIELLSLTDRISKVESLKDDLCLRLKVSANKVLIGETELDGLVYRTIEIPNCERTSVPATAVIPAIPEGGIAKQGLRVCLGVDTSGRPFDIDVSTAPHMLVAGQSGSGKSVFLNSVICGLLDNNACNDINVCIVDPKGNEFTPFEGHPLLGWSDTRGDHHDCGHIYTSDEASSLLNSLVGLMNERLQEIKRMKCKNLRETHVRHEANPFFYSKMPYIVVVIDEFYDLLMNYPELEAPLGILAAKARAAGIHLILATQRPSVDVIRGALKANLSTRIALKVSSGTDSKVIIDRTGAESLCGLGDMLYVGPTDSIPRRLHGCYVGEDDIKEMVSKGIERYPTFKLSSDGRYHMVS